ncbi:MAG: hypothetical protein M1825_006312 [Sarcosagium campestre]|nr:MAG: hypothetical protein M1825_006312 [Sarcosagium campestre]
MAEGPTEEAKVSLIQSAKKWGESSVPPTLLATLIASQHLQPPQYLPLSFVPVLLFSTYLNINSFSIDAAGLNAAWSGLYLVLARRRKQGFVNKWGVRGIVRGATMGLCAANVVGGGLTYALGRRKDEDAKRQDGLQ